MDQERTFTLTEGEVIRLLMLADIGLIGAHCLVNQLAISAHSRHSTRQWLDGSAYRQITNHVGFPGLAGGAGDGNRTRIASLEGGGQTTD
jgi:hypothetical protein